MSYMLADGRWYIRLMGDTWEIFDTVQGEIQPVRVMANEPGLTADLVLERWKQERADDENLGDL